MATALTMITKTLVRQRATVSMIRKTRPSKSLSSSCFVRTVVAPSRGIDAEVRAMIFARSATPPYRGARRRRETNHNDDRGLRRFSSDRGRDETSAQGRRRGRGGGFKLRALPFSVSPEEALGSFRAWADNDQGLSYLVNHDSVRLGAAYVPVWSFDANVRFKQRNQGDDPSSSSLYSWKPPTFDGYGPRQEVVHVSGGLAAYAGYSYRRSLINPVHSTTLVFMGDRAEAFGGWMLEDMVVKETGSLVRVVPDTWNVTKGRAFAVVKEELQAIADHEWPGTAPPPVVQTQVVASRRVFMPTFVIDYAIMGLEYRAFVSGCDVHAPVGGVSHRVFEDSTGTSSSVAGGGLSPEFHRSSQNLLARLSDGASRLSGLINRQNLPILLSMLRPVLDVLRFALVRAIAVAPVIGVAGGLFAGFRKVLRPWMDNRDADAEWERQRRREADEEEHFFQANDFDDVGGRARAHFERNRDAILRSLSGDVVHQEGDYDWYSDWQAWARRRWEQQARQQQQHGGQRRKQQTRHRRQQNQRRRPRSEPKTKRDDGFEEWPFDPNDPYSVLGVDRRASGSEVSGAFRREMLRFHPDAQPPSSTEAQKRRAVERSKLITEAYRKIKTERKEMGR